MRTLLTTTITMVLTDDENDNLSEQETLLAVNAIEDAIKDRLFGAGFLPDYVEARSWRVHTDAQQIS